MTAEVAARRFLDACADMEQALKTRHNLALHGLGRVVDAALPSNPVVRAYERDLRMIAQLRNVIAHHSYRNGAPIATPLPETVAAATAIRDEILKPSTVDSVLGKSPLYRVGHEDPLRFHLAQMVHLSYSQVPVFDSTGFVGLLTTNAIARWVARAMDDAGDVLIERAHVADVLQFAEDHERAHHIQRTTTVAEAMERFMSPGAPAALLVTQSGKRTEQPLGMLVPADLPRLRSKLQVTLN